MKIRGNVVGTTQKPEKVVVNATGLTEEEKAQARANFGVSSGGGADALAEILTKGKNIIDPSKVLYNGNGDLNATTGALGDGTSYIYGKYHLNVGETYTVSKKEPDGFGYLTAFLYFYNADGTYAGNASTVSVSATVTEKTFTATHPVVIIKALKDIAPCSFQIEQGEKATEYEPYRVVLKDNVKLPIVGEGELATDAKTIIPAINELHESTTKIPSLEEDVQEVYEDNAAIEKVMPRLNEEITGWTNGFIINANGTVGTSAYYAYSNKVRLRAGQTYYVGESYMTYTVCYDLDGNFVGRNTCDGMTITKKTSYGSPNNYYGTITVGNSDIYVVLQTTTAKIETVYISRFADEKANTEINENLLISKTLMGKKVLIFGDSISTGDTSAKVHAGEKYGNYNKWVEQLVAENYLADCNVRNDSIHATGFVARFNGEDDLITRLRNTTDTDYDLVIVFAGINDSLRANSISVGFGMDESGSKQTDITKYFVPAVDTFFAELTDKFVDARICVVLPLRTKYKYAGHRNAPGALYDGSTSRLETDYADYIAKVAEEYCLPVLDATRHSGFAPFNTAFAERWVCRAERGDGDSTLVPDGVHPNEEYCQKYLSKYIRGFIDGLI